MKYKDKKEVMQCVSVHGAEEEGAARVAGADEVTASGVLDAAETEVSFNVEVSAALVVASGSAELELTGPEEEGAFDAVVDAVPTELEEALLDEVLLDVAVLLDSDAMMLFATSCMAEMVPSDKPYVVGTPGWSSCIHGTVYPPTLISTVCAALTSRRPSGMIPSDSNAPFVRSTFPNVPLFAVPFAGTTKLLKD